VQSLAGYHVFDTYEAGIVLLGTEGPAHGLPTAVGSAGDLLAVLVELLLDPPAVVPGSAVTRFGGRAGGRYSPASGPGRWRRSRVSSR
jgi:hypothetical protein